MIARRIIVRGRVQGVFYRNWTVGKARELGINGWVRNRADESVEILACGEAKALEALIDACRSGPPAARVTDVQVRESSEPCPEGFETKPSL